MRQVVFMPEPLLVLAAAPMLAGLLAGIILLIVGLAMHRRGLWIAGLVTLLVALAIGALAGAALLMVAA